MSVSVEKPGSPEEVLAHFGAKGMKWGVRKNRSSTNKARTPMSTKKKVAIGVGVTAVAVGAAATIYYLNKNGKLPLSSLRSGGKGGGKVFKNLDEAIAAKGKIKVSAIAQARQTVNRERYIELMMSSKKYTPSLADATRIANEVYGRL